MVDIDGGAFATHHAAMKTILSLPPGMQFLISHGSDVLADVISSHRASSPEELGEAIRVAMMKRGHTTQKEGGSFWTDIGKGIQSAWKKTLEFAKTHTKDIAKGAVDVVAEGAKHFLPDSKQYVDVAKDAAKTMIGSALPTSHLVGALHDVCKAHGAEEKCRLIMNDHVLTGGGVDASPLLMALHFATHASPHINDALGGGIFDFLKPVGKFLKDNAKTIGKAGIGAAAGIGSILQPELAPILGAAAAAANSALD